nr:hypothetical protein [Tanacetum cinerariifolium]
MRMKLWKVFRICFRSVRNSWWWWTDNRFIMVFWRKLSDCSEEEKLKSLGGLHLLELIMVQVKRKMVASDFGEDQCSSLAPRPVRIFFPIASVGVK